MGERIGGKRRKWARGQREEKGEEVIRGNNKGNKEKRWARKKRRKVVKQDLRKGTNESKISSMTNHNGFSSLAIIKLGPFVPTHNQ
jgi:hypothetical protein